MCYTVRVLCYLIALQPSVTALEVLARVSSPDVRYKASFGRASRYFDSVESSSDCSISV